MPPINIFAVPDSPSRLSQKTKDFTYKLVEYVSVVCNIRSQFVHTILAVFLTIFRQLQANTYRNFESEEDFSHVRLNICCATLGEDIGQICWVFA